MVDSVVSNSDDIIESLEVDQQRLHQEDQESSVTKHLFTNEIFERDDLWNVFNIVQQVDVNNPNKTSSGVWKYFGKLHYDNQIIDEGYFYCISCYANRVTKKYQTNTSTGNLIKHMIRSHDILLEQPIYRIKRENDSYTVVKEEFRGDMLGNSFNTSTDDFIYDINQILIDEVHKRPQLYDSALCRKNKHQIRQELWFEVYRKLNEIIPLERLPKIWKNIRDRYRKVRRTCEKDESKVPRYRYYEKLRFLDSVIDSSMSRSSQPMLVKSEENEFKEKCVYYVEHKNSDDLFEMVQMDDMESEEVANEHIESYEETVQDNATLKYETISRRRRNSSEETNDLSNYEYQDDSELGDNEIFTIDNVDDEQQPQAKRAKIIPPSSQDEHISTAVETTSNPIDKSSGVCEFEIFGNYVAAVMKNMKRNDARQLQMKIVQLINSNDEVES